MNIMRGIWMVSLWLLWLPTPGVSQQPAGPLRVGAARVDITPAARDLPAQYLGILDHVYSRSIVIDNGHEKVALVTVDALFIPDAIWEVLASRIAAATQIPARNLVITATGTHSVPAAAAGSRQAAEWEERIVESVVLALRSAQPARMSYGSGVSYINVQRDRIDPVTRRWWEGADYDGVSDKSVDVIQFRAISGKPIAVYYNYGVFNVVTGTLDLVSGDITGASSRYIEDAFGGDVVAVLSAGPHGDQNPLYFQQTYDLREIRIRDYARRGEDIATAMPPPGGVGLDRRDPVVARLMEQQKQMILSMGQMLGEEVLRAMREARGDASAIQLFSGQKLVSCPGRSRTNEGRGGLAGTYVDAAPVQLRLGLTMVGDVAIGSVNAGIYTAIGQRLERESPYAKTMITTAANGFAGTYVPDDASYGHETFAVLNSRLKPGCAESAIVSGIIEMMPKLQY